MIKNINITKNTDKKKYFDTELCYNLTDVLDEYNEYWDKCQLFVVEQQMSFGKKTNTKALKLAQHTESYFIFKLQSKKLITVQIFIFLIQGLLRLVYNV